jgi:hypothetical protein
MSTSSLDGAHMKLSNLFLAFIVAGITTGCSPEGLFKKSELSQKVREPIPSVTPSNSDSGGGACNLIKACDKGTHLDQRSCACVPDASPCLDFVCAAPPEGCHYEASSVDQAGCPVGCGILKCEPKVDQCPPVPDCAAPPQGCVYQMQYDSNGCVVSCGPMICTMPPDHEITK